MKSSAEKIQFHYLVRSFYFPERKRVKKFLMDLIRKEGREVEAINYIFCDDAYLLKVNQEFLAHDTLTDIITFELSHKNQPLIADIYISIERVIENSRTYHASFSKELRRVIFHGALHLVGYKDKNQVQVRLMRQKEEDYLMLYQVSRSTVSK